MYTSLQLLKTVIGNASLVCPSHDYNNEFATSIAAETTRNTLLTQVVNNEINSEEFSFQKSIMDTQILDETGSEIMCGALFEHCHKTLVVEYDSNSLVDAIKQSDKIQLIDVREAHEYALQHDEKFAINVPLNRLVQFAREHQQDKQVQFVLACRSGSRSQLAAQALGRLGFEHVGHLKGGYALHQY
jgi:rhodanese-related sulfurtransferase